MKQLLYIEKVLPACIKSEQSFQLMQQNKRIHQPWAQKLQLRNCSSAATTSSCWLENYQASALPCSILKPGAERNSKDLEHQLPNRHFNFGLIFRWNISTPAVTTSWKVVIRMYHLICFTLKATVNNFHQCWDPQGQQLLLYLSLRLLLRRNYRRKSCSSCSDLVPHWLLTNYQPHKYKLGIWGLWTVFCGCDPFSPFASCSLRE